MKAQYFVTQNLISPFVVVLGDWEGADRSNLIHSVRAGVSLGSRPALEIEKEWVEASTRHVFIYWKSLREMLWAHRGPDLLDYYGSLIGKIRKNRHAIKTALAVVEKKKVAKKEQRRRDDEVKEGNKRRLSALAESQLFLRAEDEAR